jgi:DNA-binding NtrC family response regulator
MTVLNVLLIDDDDESLALLSESLPPSIEGKTIRWEPCGSFEQAFRAIAERRFDVVVTDIYRDRQKKEPVTGDPQGKSGRSQAIEAIQAGGITAS